MSEISYRVAEPHTTVRYTFTASCAIDPGFIKPWDAYTEAQKDEFFLHGPLPCDGGFRPGLWCEDCRFGHVSVFEAEEDHEA